MGSNASLPLTAMALSGRARLRIELSDIAPACRRLGDAAGSPVTTGRLAGPESEGRDEHGAEDPAAGASTHGGVPRPSRPTRELRSPSHVRPLRRALRLRTAG